MTRDMTNNGKDETESIQVPDCFKLRIFDFGGGGVEMKP